MANYKTMYDILKNPLSTRREIYGTTAIRRITIDGNEFGGYKAFSSFWEKTYVKEPTRSSSGVIDNLNSYTTFVTFHLKCDFAMMSIDDYRRLYDLMLDRNEFTVTAYNVLTNSNYTCKMYFAPDQMPKLYMVARKLNGESFTEVLGVQDYTIELIGTNASMEKVKIRYYDENDQLIPNATQQVDKGVEAIVNYNYTASSGNRFDGQWGKIVKDKEEDKEVAVVNNGNVITPLENIKLKAKVVPTNQYTLSLDYGVGIKPIPQDGSKQVDNFTITYGQTIGNAISSANITLSDGTTFAFPSSGTGVEQVEYDGEKRDAYDFVGWYWTTSSNDDTKVQNTTSYDYTINRTIHQIYQPKSFTVTYVTNKTTISYNPQTIRYKDKVTLPIFTIGSEKIVGWYLDSKYEKSFDGIMPPKDITLYAEWE